MREKGKERSERERREKKREVEKLAENVKRRKKSRSAPVIFTSCCDIVLRCLTLSFLSLLFLSLLSEEKEDRKREKEREREREGERKRERSQLMPSRNHSRWVDVLRLSSLYLWIPDNFIWEGKKEWETNSKRERKRRTKWEAVKKERERKCVDDDAVKWEDFGLRRKRRISHFSFGKIFCSFLFLSLYFFFSSSIPFFSVSLFLSISFSEDKDF